MHKFFDGDVNRLLERRYDDKGPVFETDVFAGGGEAPLRILATAGERTNAEYFEAIMTNITEAEAKAAAEQAEAEKKAEAKAKANPPENKSLTPKLENK